MLRLIWLLTPGCLALGEWSHLCGYMGLQIFFFFWYSFSVYSCHFFLISSASVRPIPFLSFIEPIFAWNVPLVSLIFLKRFLVFPFLLFSSTSLHWSRRKAFLSLLCSVYQLPLNTLHQEEKECDILFLFPSDGYVFPFPFGVVCYVAADTLHRGCYWEWDIATTKT